MTRHELPATVSVTTPQWTFRPDVEGLRAIAIVFVVLFHAGLPLARGGFLGVDVFFVLSGFLITGILVEEVDRTGTVSLTKFWARRARRLLPAAAVMTIVVLAVAPFVMSPFERGSYTRTAVAFALYGSNLLFFHRSSDYFAASVARDPLLHTWSLSVEEQFYVVFAPLILMLARFWAAAGASTLRRRLSWIVTALSVASFLVCVVAVRVDRALAFYTLPTRIWEFGIGALLAINAGKGAMLSQSGRNGLLAFGLAGLAACVATIDASMLHPGWVTILPVVATAAVIVASDAAQHPVLGGILAIAPLRMIGRVSYSWYLWHWPLLVFLKAFVGAPSFPLRLIVAVGALLPAVGMYTWIEAPVRYSKWLSARPMASLLGAGALAASVLLVTAIGSSRSTTALAMLPLAPISRAREERPEIYADGCFGNYAVTTPKACAYGPASDTSIALFGDSNAAQWFPAFERIAQRRRWNISTFTKSSCPSVSVTIVRDSTPYPECDEWRANVFHAIARQRPQIVIISHARYDEVMLGSRAEWLDSSAVAIGAWRLGMAKTIEALQATGATVLLMRTTPRPGFDVPTCVARFLNHPERCAFDASRAQSARLSAAEDDVALAHEVRVLDLNADICTARVCPASRDGIPLYSDDHHLSVAFAKSLTPRLSALLYSALMITESRAR